MPDSISTTQSEEVPEGYDIGPEALGPGKRRDLMEKWSGLSAADLVGRIWTGAPHDPAAYIQLVGGCLWHNRIVEDSISKVDRIEQCVPDEALDALPALTKVQDWKQVLVIGEHKTIYERFDGKTRFDSHGTEAVIGPIAKLLGNKGADRVHPKALSNAASDLVELGDVDQLERLLNAAANSRQEEGNGTAPPTATAEATGRPPAAPRPIDLTTTLADDDERPEIKTVRSVSKRRFNGLTPARYGWYSDYTRPKHLNTRPKRRPHSAAIKARVDLMPEQEIESLLQREPKGEIVKYLGVPDDLYTRCVEWSSPIEEYKPCAAIFQKNLLDYNRDDDWFVEDDCTGMPTTHTFVFGAFGMAPRTGWNRGLSAEMLLEIYRRTVDEDFRWSGWYSAKGKSRVVKAHGIPDDIIVSAKRAMLGPNNSDNWTYLINGKDAGNRHFTGALREERREEIKNQDPVIEPPEVTKEIQEYLNGLDQQYFAHGGYGKLRPEQLAKASEAAAGFRKEQRRDQANRKLIQMRTHPQPLYDFCDRFPRLKADAYNQAMNLPPEMRWPMYTGRDYEVDLDKAHLGCYVPVVRREGIEVPTLEKYLAANLKDDTRLLERGDLWWDLASMVDTDVFSDLSALRTAVKRAYSSVYGSTIQTMLFRIYELYAQLTGDWPEEGIQPLKAIMDHPLMQELFNTRDKLEAIITSRGGLEDANGRFIPLEAWDDVKKKENRWRGCMAYVNCSFEQEIMYPIFDLARQEMERDGHTRFKVWLYQGDGVTINVGRRVRDHDKQIGRLQKAVKDRADELDVPTRLEVDFTPEQ